MLWKFINDFEKKNENGLDLGIMDVWWVQVYARAQSGMVEAHGFCWKVAQVS